MDRKRLIFVVLDITLKGGIERFVSNISQMFSDDNVKITIISFHKSNPEPLYSIPSNVQIIYLTSFQFRTVLYKFTTFLACLRLIKFLRSQGGEYKLISTSPIILIYLYLMRQRKILALSIASEHSTYNSHKWLI